MLYYLNLSRVGGFHGLQVEQSEIPVTGALKGEAIVCYCEPFNNAAHESLLFALWGEN
jgi:hypothetical protein